MLRALILAATLALTSLFTIPAHADRHDVNAWGQPQSFAPVHLKRAKHVRTRHERATRHARSTVRQSYASGEAQIVAHPAGCPSRAFCGCGVALHVFGRPVRELWLASNWFAFPRAHAAPGMVAVRRHHVMAILTAYDDNTAIVYDPNSGGHQTRIHRRSLAGYVVVDPRAGRRYAVR